MTDKLHTAGLEREPQPCPVCHGEGSYAVPECCGRPGDECCGMPIPAQEQCRTCSGTGYGPAQSPTDVVPTASAAANPIAAPCPGRAGAEGSPPSGSPPAAAGPGEVTVTCNEDGQCVAVTRTDEEGRILSVIWEAPHATHQGSADQFRADCGMLARALRNVLAGKPVRNADEMIAQYADEYGPCPPPGGADINADPTGHQSFPVKEK